MLDQKASISHRAWRVHSQMAVRLAAPELPSLDELKEINLSFAEMSTHMLSYVERQVREDMETYLWNQEQNDLVQVFLSESSRLIGEATATDDWQKMVLALNALGLAQVATKLLHDSKSFADWAANARKHANVLTQGDVALLDTIDATINEVATKMGEVTKLVGSDLEQSRHLFQESCDLVEGLRDPYRQFYSSKN